MTIQEAIADIRDNIKPVVGGKSLDMAIKALEQQENVHDTCKKCVEFSEFEQQPSDDCISRAQALHACCNEWNKDYKAIMKSIRKLPSVTPKQRVGKWMLQENIDKPSFGFYICSECGAYIGESIKCCSSCGSKMEVEE